MADLPQLPSPTDPDFSGKSGEAGAEKQGVFASILESLQTQTSLLFEIDDNTESDETATEKRNRRVEAENTDKKGMFSGAIGGLGAGLKGVGGVLNKVNPFQEGGLGTKMSILLISGVLFAISKFGDKLVKPLANVLEMIGSEGSILDKLKDTELFKSAMETFEKIGERAKTIADDVAKLLESATAVGTLIQSAYESIEAYVLKFDANKDGKLDFEESKVMFKEITDKITEKVSGYISLVTMGILGIMFGPALINVAIKVGGALIAKAIAGGGAAAAVATAGGSGPGMMSRGASLIAKNAAKLGIAGIVAAGIIGVYTASKNAFANAAVDEQGKIKKESFAGFFIAGGDGEGGVKNSVENAIKLSAIGGALGVGLKFATAGAVGGPMGILAGGLLGMAVGALIGATTGAVGADKMTSVITSVTTTLGNAVDDVARFFGGVVAGIESFVQGKGYTAGRNAYMLQNAESPLQRASEIEILENDVAIEQQLYDQTTGKPKQAALKQLNLAKSRLRDAKREDNKLIEMQKQRDLEILQGNLNEADKLPGLYTALAGADNVTKSKARGPTLGKTAYEVILGKIQKIEGSIPAYMLNDVMQQIEAGPNTSGETISKLSNTTKSNGDSSALPLTVPVLVDQKEINNINSSYSGSPSSSNGFQPARLFGDSLLVDWRSM